MSNAKRRHRRARRLLRANLRLRDLMIAFANGVIRATHKCPWSMQAHADAWELKKLAEGWLR